LTAGMVDLERTKRAARPALRESILMTIPVRGRVAFQMTRTIKAHLTVETDLLGRRLLTILVVPLVQKSNCDS
jgi:hypothetical protein